MADQVKVTSLDALESFRASTIVFLTKARRAVDMAIDDVRRTRQWVTVEQKLHWETQLKRRLRALEQARQELISAKFSEFNDSQTMQKMAEKKALRMVEEAETKLRNIKAWGVRYDSTFDPMLKKLESLKQYLEFDMPKSVAYLSQAQRTLEDYTRIVAPDSAAPPAAAE